MSCHRTRRCSVRLRRASRAASPNAPTAQGDVVNLVHTSASLESRSIAAQRWCRPQLRAGACAMRAVMPTTCAATCAATPTPWTCCFDNDSDDRIAEVLGFWFSRPGEPPVCRRGRNGSAG